MMPGPERNLPPAASDACDRFGERIVAAHYEEPLSPEERRELDAHLVGCGACTAFAGEVRRTASGLDELGVAPPDPARWEGMREAVIAHAHAVATGPGDEALAPRPARPISSTRARRGAFGFAVRQAAVLAIATTLGVLVGAMAFQEPSYAAHIRRMKVEGDRLYDDVLDFRGALVHYEVVAAAGSDVPELAPLVDDAAGKVAPLQSYLDGTLGRRADADRRTALERAIGALPAAPYVHGAVIQYASLALSQPISSGGGSAGGEPVEPAAGGAAPPVDRGRWVVALEDDFVAELRIRHGLNPRQPDVGYWKQTLGRLQDAAKRIDEPGVRAAARLQVAITHERLGDTEAAVAVYQTIASDDAAASGDEGGEVLRRVVDLANAKLRGYGRQ